MDEVIATASGGSLSARIALRDYVEKARTARYGARAEITAFVGRAAPRDWLTLDQAMRAHWYGESAPSQSTPIAGIRGLLESFTRRRGDVVDSGLASMGRDGRIREMAVRDLADE